MADHPTPAWADTPPTAARIAAVLNRLASVMRADAWRGATAEGLTPTQADLLALMAARSTGVRLGWLAEQLSVTSATASDAVAALVTKGWVKKLRAADDARALSLSLTDAGHELAQRLAAPSRLVESAAAALPTLAQDQLLAVLLQLVGELQRSEAFPELRACVTCQHFEPQRHQGSDAPHHCHLVGAALPARLLRIDCPEHVAVSAAFSSARWLALRSDTAH